MATTKEYSYAVGRRKEASATVKLYSKGKGSYNVVIESNNVELRKYFGEDKTILENIFYPFQIIGIDAIKNFDADIVVRGGGTMGQAEAIRLAFARALIEYNPEYKITLKPYGLLKRDDRTKERKKPGLRGARRSPQWSKR